MKDAEFIQLLNLYLDHEISAADAVRLEAEVQNNPARRRIYQEYCRMQKACKVLAEEFRSESVAVPEPNVIDFEAAQRRARMGNFYTIGAFAAAAACVAIIFVGRSRQEAARAVPDDIAAHAVAPAALQPTTVVATPSPAQSVAQTVSLPATDVSRGPLLLGNQLYLSRKAQPDTTIRPTAEQLPEQFAWMPQIQLAPIQPANPDLRFDTPSSALRTEPRAYNNRQQPVDASVEMTAFRFQR